MNTTAKVPLLSDEQIKLKHFLVSNEMKLLILDASTNEQMALEAYNESCFRDISSNRERQISDKTIGLLVEAEKWRLFKKVLEEMTDSSYSFGKPVTITK